MKEIYKKIPFFFFLLWCLLLEVSFLFRFRCISLDFFLKASMYSIILFFPIMDSFFMSLAGQGYGSFLANGFMRSRTLITKKCNVSVNNLH